MSEEKTPYEIEGEKWMAQAAEVRRAVDNLGLTQAAAARELDVSERSMRGYMSGREAVPRVVLYALRYLEENKPTNPSRFLQVHWKKLHFLPQRDMQFGIELRGELFSVWIQNDQYRDPIITERPFKELLQQGVVSVHKSSTPDRFEISADLLRSAGLL
jgi:hypothetical protein